MIVRRLSENSLIVRSIARGLQLGTVLVLISLLAISSFLSASSTLSAQDEATRKREREILNNGVGNVDLDKIPLIERAPFDRMILDEESENAVLDIFPVPPAELSATGGKLIFRLIDEPDGRRYQVDRKHIVNIVTYPQLILAKATELMETKTTNINEERDNLAEAFLYYDYLMHHPQYASLPEVLAATNNYLYVDAYNLITQKKFEEAVGVLEVLYQRDKNYKGKGNVTTANLLERTFGKLIDALIDRHDYRLAERYMADVDFRYKNEFKKTTDSQRRKITQLALEYRDQAAKLADEGKELEAYEALRQMRNISPSLPEGKEIEAEILRRFPMVAVGVTQRATTPDPKSLHNWASRRLGRLNFRTLVEYTGQGEDGGVYEFPQGKIERSEDGLSFDFIIREKAAKPGLPFLDSYSIADRLLTLANDKSHEHVPAWSQLFESVTAVDPQLLRVKLRQAHVLPESLLQIALQTIDDPKKLPPPNGYYKLSKSTDTEMLFMPKTSGDDTNKDAKTDKELPKVLEKFYEDGDDAVADLKRGDIDIIDRIFPADYRELKAQPDITIRRYAVPTVHMLIPNLENEFLQSTYFRKAILHAIDRENVLTNRLLGKSEIPGCRVVSGPFPIGIGADDPIAYGYNSDVAPATGDAYHAAILLLLADDDIRLRRKRDREAEKAEAEREARAKRKAAGEPEPEPEPVVEEEPKTDEDGNPLPEEKEKLPEKILRLAYPDNKIASDACKAIVAELDLVNVEVVLKKLPPGATVPKDDDYDLLYTEVTMEEPLIDARALLVDSGMVTGLTSPVEHALRELDRARNWSQVRKRLHDLHFQCNSEVIVLPLWQITEHYAYRNNLHGVSKMLVSRSNRPGVTNFYENVNDWRIVPESAEK